ncbi:hypothetical protein PU630_02275 [Microbacterium horticulturae]|uniref:DUF1453 domain-containing protein n=1 Tax=Microbacterium horticulturae TaxID=3028316 RepID=A0ABY8BZW6_9MICO|nr:hypothetical protein [Microbacterium sp. KACC 23027]WEG09417.1 hypothetical protein PU630_02275 [Microbacterium sp. KACC 23027]
MALAAEWRSVPDAAARGIHPSSGISTRVSTSGWGDAGGGAPRLSSMDLETFIDIVLGIAIICWIGYRQTTWRPVSTGSMYRMSLILAVVGVVLGASSLAAMNGLDLAVLVAELVISLAIGAWIGALARFRRLDPPVSVGRRGTVADHESRTGWWGLLLWLSLIAVRVGMDVAATAIGARVATTAGVILLLLAANRAARTAMIAHRVERLRLVAA